MNTTETKPLTRRILGYKYADAKQMLWSIPIGHFLMALCLIFLDVNFTLSPRILINLLVLVSSIILIRMMDWSNNRQVITFFVSYYVLFLIEMTWLGIPASAIDLSQGSSKGMLGEMLVAASPYVYVLFRMVMGLLLLLPLKVLRKNWSRADN